VDVGLLCHPGKLVPPSPVVQYCGFLFDTTGEPALHIQVDKREKILTAFDFTLQQTELSRLSLAIVAGLLESVSPATPSNLGQTYLGSLYGLIHPIASPDTEGQPPLSIYYTSTNIPDDVLNDKLWWRAALIHNPYQRC
jgi:hypothetical protein